jgi:hypothetical protein
VPAEAAPMGGAGLAGFAPGLLASRDLSVVAALAAGLSDLRSVLAGGFAAVSGGASVFGSESGAAFGAATQRATAASVKQVSRTAFTDPDLSAATRRSHPSFDRQRLKKG